jgi:hypothetical protein
VGVVLFNRGETEVQDWSFDLRDVGVATEVTVRDLWSHTHNGTSTGGKVTVKVVASHGVVALRLTSTRKD